MLVLYDVNHNKLDGIVNYKELKIDKEINLDNTLSFLYPVSDPKHDLIKEECYICTKDNEYIVKEVNFKDDDWTEYICKINIEDIKGKDVGHFETIAQSCSNSVNLALVGTGWIIGSCNVTKLRTVRKNNCNAYIVLQEIQSAYTCEMTFDAITKKVYIYQSLGTDKGSYFAEQLNLKKLDVQRNSYDYITRLIPLGKDGLDITSVNGGLNYVQNNQYSNKVITAYWEDNRYTVVQDLKDDAIAKLDYLSKPYKAYKADVIDLANINTQYTILDYSLGDTITLLAKSKNTKEKQRIIKLTQYPDEPERNTCEIANKLLSLEYLQVRFVDTADVVDTVTTVDGLLDGTKVDGIDWSKLQNVHIVIADIQDLNAVTARIGTLETTTAHITNGIIDNATIDIANVNDLAATYATIINLTAVNGAVNALQSTSVTTVALDAEVVRINWLYGNVSLADELSAAEANINILLANKATIIDLNATNLVVTNLSGDLALFESLTTDNFTAANADIEILIADDATFTNLFAGNITTAHIKTLSLLGTEFAATSVVKVGTGNDIAILTGSHATYRLFIGNVDPTLAPFSVTQLGKFLASNAEITGKITATEGLFTGSILVGNDNAGINGDVVNPIRFWSGGTSENASFKVYDSGLIEARQLRLLDSLEANNSILTGILRVGDEGILIDGNAGSISSVNFASDLSGWMIDNNGSAEFSNVSVRGEIVSSVFAQNEIHAEGGSLLIRPAGILGGDIVYAGTGDIFVLVESTSGHFQQFSQDDILRIKDIWLRVKTIESIGAEYYRYTCAKVSGAAAFTLSKGETIVDMGQIGQGGIKLTASESNSPYMDIYENTATPWTTQTLKVRLGKLSGIVDSDFGNLIGYGLYSDNAYLKGSLFLPDSGMTNASGNGSPVRFWAGSTFANRESAPFKVLQDGSLFATKGIFSGELQGVTGTFSGSIDVGNVIIGSDGIFQIKDDAGENVVVGSKLGLSVYGEGFDLYPDSFSNLPFLSVAKDDWRYRVRADRLSTWNVHRALANEPMERRNLVLNSQNVQTVPNNVGRGIAVKTLNELIPYWRVTGTVDISTYENVFYNLPSLVIGRIYTISCEVRVPTLGNVSFFAGIGVNLNIPANVWTKIYYTFTQSLNLRVGGHTYSGLQLDYRNWKLELGNKATDWTPAPEDLTPPTVDTHRVAALDNGAMAFSFLEQNMISDFDFEEKSAYKATRNFKVGTLDSEQGKLLSYTDDPNGNIFFLGMDSLGNEDLTRKVKIGVNKNTANETLDILGTLGVSDLINMSKAQIVYRPVDNGLDIIIYD